MKRGYDLKTLVKSQQLASNPKKAKKKGLAPMRDETEFKLDTSDARFQAVFQDPEFHIDPTHPQFKKTAGSEQLLVETQKRHLQKQQQFEEAVRAKKQAAASMEKRNRGEGQLAAPVNKAALSALVASVKGKSALLSNKRKKIKLGN